MSGSSSPANGGTRGAGSWPSRRSRSRLRTAARPPRRGTRRPAARRGPRARRAHRQRKCPSVGFKVVRHLVLGRERVAVALERACRQAPQTCAGVKSRSESHRLRQTSPTRSLGIQNDERHAAPLQVIPGRKPGLPAADDDCVHALRSVLVTHDPASVARLHVRDRNGRSEWTIGQTGRGAHRPKCAARVSWPTWVFLCSDCYSSLCS